jgi:carboxyl-terminal processing protease
MSLPLPRAIALGLVTLLTLAAVLPAGAAPTVAQDASPGPAASPAAVSPGAAASPGAAIPSPVPFASDACVEPEASLAPVAEETLSMPEEFRIGLFDGVWQGIRDAYVDPDTNGLDWEAIGDEYAPLVIATDNAYEVYELLGEMVALLEDPYTGFFSPEDLGDPEAVDPSYGGIGALVDTGAAGEGSEGLRITYVFDGGSAKEAGIRPRDRVVAVAGDPCARVADIRGPEGTSITVTVVSPGQEPREVSLERRRIEPLILPEARRLEAAPGVGYLRVISLSGQEAIDAIEQALTRFVRDEPLEGLVIDLRGSNQGAPGVILEALRPFASGDVGAFHFRSGSEPIEIEPSDLADDYAGVPVVVLVDEDTEADAEQLAAILQDQDRATVVGAKTSGQTHGAQTVDFADGSLLQVVTYGFQLPDGRTLEGQGVTPDVEVTADWLDYPEAEDPGILAALEVIESPTAESPTAELPSAEPSASPSGEPSEPAPSPSPAG